MKQEPQDIVKQINRVLRELDNTELNSDHYKDLVSRLSELLKAQDHLESLHYEDEICDYSIESFFILTIQIERRNQLKKYGRHTAFIFCLKNSPEGFSGRKPY